MLSHKTTEDVILCLQIPTTYRLKETHKTTIWLVVSNASRLFCWVSACGHAMREYENVGIIEWGSEFCSLSEVTCEVVAWRKSASGPLFIEAVLRLGNANKYKYTSYQPTTNPHSLFSCHCFSNIHIFKRWGNFFWHLQSCFSSALIWLSMLMRLLHLGGGKVMLHFMEAVTPQELWVCNVTTLLASFLVFIFWKHHS
jgi:hypothetical protein